MAKLIGVDLLGGNRLSYHGPALDARLHRVRLAHDILGAFDLDVGYRYPAPSSETCLTTRQ